MRPSFVLTIVYFSLFCTLVYAVDLQKPKGIQFTEHYFDHIIFSWKANPPEEKVTKYRVYYRIYDAQKDYPWKICYEGLDCDNSTGRCKGECKNLDYHYIYEFHARAVNARGESPPSTILIGSPGEKK